MSRLSRAALLALAVTATSVAAPEGNLLEPGSIPLPGAPHAVLVTDVDHDGVQDLVVALASGPRLVVVHGDGVGGHGAAQPIDDLPDTDASQLLGMAMTDVDLDGRVDLLGAGSPSTVWLARGDSFEPVALPVDTASHVDSIDLDRDGDPDAVLVTAAGLTVLRNDGAGQFETIDTHTIDGAWPVTELRCELGAHGEPCVTVRGGPSNVTQRFLAQPDGELVAQEVVEPVSNDTATVPETPPVVPGLLAQADLDGDGQIEDVFAAPGGAHAIVVTVDVPTTTPEVDEPQILAGRLRWVRGAAKRRRVRVNIRAQLPTTLDELPEQVTVGNPDEPLTLELDPAGWSAPDEQTVVWRGDDDGSIEGTGVEVKIDRETEQVTFSATGLTLPRTPDADVQFTFGRRRSRSARRRAWTRNRRGDLVVRAPRRVSTTPRLRHVSTPSVATNSGPADTSSSTAATSRRDRFISRTRRATTDRKATPKSVAAPPETIELHFLGPVDGSDEIRIDAGGATWTNRHWGMPHGSVALNGVDWTPRKGRVPTNAGKTRFLPAGVDFSSAKLLRSSGRDLLALDVGADHVTLKVSDSPNGPGQYEAVISLNVSRVADATDSLDLGLLAHLPLTTDTSDMTLPSREVQSDGPVIKNNAAVFDGKGSIDLPHLPLVGRPFAFAMQVRVDGKADTMGLVNQRAAHRPNQHLHLMLRGQQRPYFGFYNNDVGADRRCRATASSTSSCSSTPARRRRSGWTVRAWRIVVHPRIAGSPAQRNSAAIRIGPTSGVRTWWGRCAMSASTAARFRRMRSGVCRSSDRRQSVGSGPSAPRISGQSARAFSRRSPGQLERSVSRHNRKARIRSGTSDN